MKESIGKLEMGLQGDKTQKVIITLKADNASESLFGEERDKTGILIADKTQSLTDGIWRKKADD